MLVAKSSTKNRSAKMKVRVPRRSAAGPLLPGARWADPDRVGRAPGDRRRRRPSPTYYAKYATDLRREAADRRCSPTRAKIFAAPDSVGVGDALTARRDRGPAAPQRLYGVAQQPDGLLRVPAGLASRSSRARSRTSTRSPASSSSQDGKIRTIVSLQDNTPRPLISARAAADHQPLRREPREAALRQVPRPPAGAGAGRHLDRGQALLPARRLRPHPHHQGRCTSISRKAAKSRAPPR